MRTNDEIVKKTIENRKVLFDFSSEVFVPFLPFEQAKPFLKKDSLEDQWEPKDFTREQVINDMRDYMEFAWGKVENHRGLSADRSVNKMTAWVWLLGDDDFLKELEKAGYINYGAPKLEVVCKKYDFPIPQSDEIQNMIKGNPCIKGCKVGCGR